MYERDGEEYEEEYVAVDYCTLQHVCTVFIVLSFVCQASSLVVVLLVNGVGNYTMTT